MRLALEEAGIDIVFANDIERSKFALYAANFGASDSLLGDVTYVRTWEGGLYVATVIDIASRRVVGYLMPDHLRTELVADALRMALENRRPAPA